MAIKRIVLILMGFVAWFTSLFLAWTFLSPTGGLVQKDISSRVRSPDNKIEAVLIRRRAFDLNFVVMVKNCETRFSRFHELHYSHDFDPDPRINWHEDISWYDGGRYLVFTLHHYHDKGRLESWAYDFDNQLFISDEAKIAQIMARQ